MQPNFRGGLLEHALNPALLGSPKGPQPETEWASVPRGAGGHGGRILGATWVLGKCMAYQVRGRAWAGRWLGQTFGAAAVPPPASLDFGLAAGRGSQTALLAPLALQGWKRAGSKPLGPASLPAAQGAGEKPAPSHGPGGARTPGCAGRTCWIKPGRLQPPSPSLLAPRQQRAGAAHRSRSPPGSASFCHPSPSRLQSCLAPWREWHGAGMPHRPPAPSRTRTELGAATQPSGGLGAGAMRARRMALTAKWATPTRLPSTPVCRRGRRVPPWPTGECRLRDSALTPHLLSGKCLITVHS